MYVLVLRAPKPHLTLWSEDPHVEEIREKTAGKGPSISLLMEKLSSSELLAVPEVYWTVHREGC